MEMATKLITELNLADYNPRAIDEKSLSGLRSSIKEFGLVEPIVWNRQTNTVVGGHQRIKALEAEGHEKVDVVVVNLDEIKEKALNIALNSKHISGDWTDDILPLIAEVKDSLPDLFTNVNMDDLFDEVSGQFKAKPKEGETDPDEVPDLPAGDPAIGIRNGDIWTLGNHRLMVGDATKLSDVENLMAGKLANLVFTDPPYNVDYTGFTKEQLKIKNDKMEAGAFKDFLESSFKNIKQMTDPEAGIYICHGSSWQREFQNAIEAAGLEIRCQLIWAKNTFAWGMSRYKFQHEPIFYLHHKGKSDSWYGDLTQSTLLDEDFSTETLWREKKPAANRLHPTMKPINLINRALDNSSKIGEIVLDVFGGSGSTMIACEKYHRHCYMMELDPKYAYVILKRWEDYTGEIATRQDGVTFTSLFVSEEKELNESTM